MDQHLPSVLPDKSNLTDVQKRIAICFVRSGGLKSKKSRDAFLHQLSRRRLSLPHEELQALIHSSAFQVYVRRKRQLAKLYIKRGLEADAPNALQDYLWSREKAKEEGDYKEVRLGAQDAFDRLGVVSKKESEQTNRIVITLRGRNFDAHDLDRELPVIQAEEIVEPEIVE